MLVADLPPVPAQETPIVWVQTMPRFGEDGARLDGVRNEATCGAMPVGYCALRGLPVYETVTLAAASTSARKMTYGVCQFAPQPGYSGFATELSKLPYMNDFLPKEFRDRLGKHSDLSQEEWDWYGAWSDSFSIKVLRVPQHGKMVGSNLDKYLPDENFIGKDRVDLLVEGKDMNGRQISLKLVYFINVVSDGEFKKIDDHYYQSVKKYCGTTKSHWRISDGVDGATSFSAWLASTQPA